MHVKFLDKELHVIYIQGLSAIMIFFLNSLVT